MQLCLNNLRNFKKYGRNFLKFSGKLGWNSEILEIEPPPISLQGILVFLCHQAFRHNLPKPPGIVPEAQKQVACL